jgi:hypothetical protein
VSCTVAALLKVAVTKLIFKGTLSWQGVRLQEETCGALSQAEGGSYATAAGHEGLPMQWYSRPNAAIVSGS